MNNIIIMQKSHRREQPMSDIYALPTASRTWHNEPPFGSSFEISQSINRHGHAQVTITTVTFLPCFLNIHKLYNVWMGVVATQDAEDGYFSQCPKLDGVVVFVCFEYFES